MVDEDPGMVVPVAPEGGGDVVVEPGVRVPERAMTWRAVRSSGPGGQNVNKVATKAELRVDVGDIQGLDVAARERLKRKAGTRLTAAGELVLTSGRTRDLKRNQEDVLEKLRELLAAAQVKPKTRRPTKPSAGSRERRLNAKRHQAQRKQSRGRVGDE